MSNLGFIYSVSSWFECIYIYIYTHVYTYIHTYLGFPGRSDGKESTCNAGDPNLKVHRDTSSISGSGRSPSGGNGNLL